MVLVLDSGNVHQQMLILNEPVPQAALNQASESLNRVAIEQTASSMRDYLRGLPILAREIGELAADALDQMDEIGGQIMYQTGFSEVLPKLADQGAKQALRLLEGQVALDGVLDDLSGRHVGAVQVIIAGENQWEELSHLTMVLGRYGTETLMGAIGIIGPPRMRYGKAISTVGYIAQRVSNFLAEVHGTARDESRDDYADEDD